MVALDRQDRAPFAMRLYGALQKLRFLTNFSQVYQEECRPRWRIYFWGQTMVAVDPVKTVGVCFFDTGFQSEYFIKADDERTLDTLADFLIESKAVIISLENFSDAETRLLRERDAVSNGAIFASPDCFGHHCLKRGYECTRACALRRQRRC